VAPRARIDERLVADGLVESRSMAQRLVMAGVVRIDGQRAHKPSQPVSAESEVTVDTPPRFVSRGGEKLDNAIDDLHEQLVAHGLQLDGARAMDIGASTGGFTDCLLQRGVQAVIAVDVGYGQLHARLRDDPRVHNLERTNARHLTPQDVPWPANVIVCDASFIPLRTVLPAPLACLEPGFWGAILCKPQFEAGRERLSRAGSKGVLRDETVREQVVEEVRSDLEALDLRVIAVVEARPRGPKGNVEYVMLVRDDATGPRNAASDVPD
jgi:23S rRNA (cytidine1920-2'-O)/16S rRNA (cytidine1409-2'-O)-methyltransferase